MIHTEPYNEVEALIALASKCGGEPIKKERENKDSKPTSRSSFSFVAAFQSSVQGGVIAELPQTVHPSCFVPAMERDLVDGVPEPSSRKVNYTYKRRDYTKIIGVNNN
jgi:hypothetical protein